MAASIEYCQVMLRVANGVHSNFTQPEVLSRLSIVLVVRGGEVGRVGERWNCALHRLHEIQSDRVPCVVLYAGGSVAECRFQTERYPFGIVTTESEMTDEFPP
ncbi:hypothetical protein EVAR_4235_1 [Eumeta japonica]|uniref:Uncharacterized protein n=1 Tax=Eumeta variegata TaxID=151549 RepID=A0A4C1TG54_EUMVA|nr:hypothetical protein EVAR_4235_1 [Eumeta japonica]